MSATDRILALCEKTKRCPLGLAGLMLPDRPWWLSDSEYGWRSSVKPTPGDATRAEARRRLDEWRANAPSIDSEPIQDWIRHVLGYFKGCYRNPQAPAGREWYASDMVIDSKRDPLADPLEHAGVNLIRRFYHDWLPTAQHFQEAYWGSKPKDSQSGPLTP
jgi:hypothetical protein